MENRNEKVNSCAITFEENKLSYSGQRCHRLPEALGSQYGHRTKCLDLSYNDLVSLRGLEAFPLLEELVLDNNQLSDSLQFPSLPALRTLSLNKNLITDLDSLMQKICTSCPCITYFSLLGNKACPNQLTSIENDDADYQRYRYFVLYHLPNLRFLDSTRVDERERVEAKQRGQFMKVVRPRNATPASSQRSFSPPPGSLRQELAEQGYSPLPTNLRRFNEHKGAYGKCRYKYSGKHSEGNRFISNKDL